MCLLLGAPVKRASLQHASSLEGQPSAKPSKISVPPNEYACMLGSGPQALRGWGPARSYL